MFTLTITSIKKDHSIPDGSDYLDVQFDILNDDEVVLSPRHAFPLDTPEDTIKADLTKFLETYVAEQATAQDNSKVEEIQKQADETIQSLEGLEINAEETSSQ